jgi:hypothetical protein
MDQFSRRVIDKEKVSQHWHLVSVNSVAAIRTNLGPVGVPLVPGLAGVPLMTSLAAVPLVPGLADIPGMPALADVLTMSTDVAIRSLVLVGGIALVARPIA